MTRRQSLSSQVVALLLTRADNSAKRRLPRNENPAVAVILPLGSLSGADSILDLPASWSALPSDSA